MDGTSTHPCISSRSDSTRDPARSKVLFSFESSKVKEDEVQIESEFGCGGTPSDEPSDAEISRCGDSSDVNSSSRVSLQDLKLPLSLDTETDTSRAATICGLGIRQKLRWM